MKRNIIIALTVTALAVLGAVWVSAYFRSSERMPLGVSAHIDRGEVFVGDSIRYTLDISAREGLIIEMPSIDSIMTGFIIRYKDVMVRNAAGRKKTEYIYVIAKDEPGKFSIAPLKIRYKENASAPWAETVVGGFDITVNSIVERYSNIGAAAIKIGGEAPIRARHFGEKDDAAPARVMELDMLPSSGVKEASGPKNILTPQDFIFIALSVLAGIAVLIFGVSYLYEKFIKRVPPPLLPHERALQKLNALKPKGAHAVTATKAICVGLYAIVKDYMREGYGIHGPELTAKEFINEVENLKDLADEDRRAIVEITRLCELAKYSEWAPAETEITASLESIRSIIKRTAK